MQRHLVTAAAVSLFVIVTTTAMAQDCGDWYRPVVCRAELVATDAAYDETRIGERDHLDLAPRGQIELELEARDQDGRLFPPPFDYLTTPQIL